MEDPIEEAVEVLAARDGLDPAAALEDLKGVAEDIGVPIEEVAEVVVDSVDEPAP